MNETPIPDGAPGKKEPGKRRGLALPPRGQALARLQDLESDGTAQVTEALPAPTTEYEDITARSNAVNTARSNAVNTARSNAVMQKGSNPVRTESSPEPQQTGSPTPAASTPPDPVRAAPAQRTSPRAAREPTTRITVDMPDSLHRQISYLSVETRRSIKDLVIAALEATYFGTEEEGH